MYADKNNMAEMSSPSYMTDHQVDTAGIQVHLWSLPCAHVINSPPEKTVPRRRWLGAQQQGGAQSLVAGLCGEWIVPSQCYIQQVRTCGLPSRMSREYMSRLVFPLPTDTLGHWLFFCHSKQYVFCPQFSCAAPTARGPTCPYSPLCPDPGNQSLYFLNSGRMGKCFPLSCFFPQASPQPQQLPPRIVCNAVKGSLAQKTMHSVSGVRFLLAV